MCTTRSSNKESKNNNIRLHSRTTCAFNQLNKRNTNKIYYEQVIRIDPTQAFHLLCECEYVLQDLVGLSMSLIVPPLYCSWRIIQFFSTNTERERLGSGLGSKIWLWYQICRRMEGEPRVCEGIREEIKN